MFAPAPLTLLVLFAPLALLALLVPMLYWLALAGLGALTTAALIVAYPFTSLAVWLLMTGATLEMTLLDLIGPAAFQTTIAAEKAAGIGLATVIAARWGGRLDPLNPAWAFVVMAVAGFMMGTHPDLAGPDTLRSAIGSMAPFALCFARIPAGRAEALLGLIRWLPSVVVALGAGCEVVGLRPLFIESGGWRLSGLGHPAFLAHVTLAGVYASLIAMYQRDVLADRCGLAINLTILVLTGARAPIAYATLVILLSLCLIPSPHVPVARRLFLILGAFCVLPVALLIGGDLSEMRVLHLLVTDAAHLSGRERLWPFFEAMSEGAPWFGWGIGAGNIVIPPGSAVAKLLKTWAAHNEYLRIRVEGGWIGLALLVVLFTAWVVRRTAAIPIAERWIMRLIFLAFAAHAVTDNVLISSPACVFMTFVACVFATGEARKRFG
jgi:hypothetical protein